MGRVASDLQQHLLQAVMLRGSIAVLLALNPRRAVFLHYSFCALASPQVLMPLDASQVSQMPCFLKSQAGK